MMNTEEAMKSVIDALSEAVNKKELERNKAALYAMYKTPYEKRDILNALTFLNKLGIEPKDFKTCDDFTDALRNLTADRYAVYQPEKPSVLERFYGISVLELYEIGRETDLVERWKKELKGGN